MPFEFSLIRRFQRLRRIDTSDYRQVYLVGDLHGRFGELERLLADNRVDPQRDLVVSVGDVIDRGEDSPACLSQFQQPGFRAVIGNHEMMALTALLKLRQGPAEASLALQQWMGNGGDWLFRLPEARQQTAIQLLINTLNWPLSLLLCQGVWRVLVIHAEVPGNALSGLLAADEQQLFSVGLWARNRWHLRDRSPVSEVDAVVVGHTPVEQPTWLGNTLYLDTGAAMADRQPTMWSLASILHCLTTTSQDGP